MMKIIERFAYAGLMFSSLIIVFSCSSKVTRVNKEKLISYVEHNQDLNQEREINNIKVHIKYCPYQLMVLQELDNGKKFDSAKLNELEKKYSPQYYFRLSFSKDNKEVIRQLGSFQRYSDMLQVFSFELGKYINASTERNDTLSLTDYAFEQDYGMSSANNTLLVFKKSDFDKAKNIHVNVGEFGLGIGSLQFVFDKKNIERVPLLDYQQSNEQ